MSFDFYVFWALCGLAPIVFAAVAASRRADAPARTWTAPAVVAAAFVATTAWMFAFGLPSPELLGIAAALGAGAQLLKPVPIALPALSGVLAATWGGLLSAQGVPLGAALAAGAVIPVVAAACAATRPVFAPPAMRDEALMLVGALGLMAATLPGVVDGWRAAVNLTAQANGDTAAAEAIPTWALAVGSSSLLLGAVYSLWSRR